jgi:lipopolysaccharide transport system permease protein
VSAPVRVPVMLLRPSRGLSLPDLREVYDHRELLGFLAWRDLKVRYQQTLLGVAWIALQPLLMAAVFAVVLGGLSGMPSQGVPYPVFVLCGVLAWTHFSASLTSAVQSLVSNAALLTKVYFPRVVLPAAAVLARGVDLAVGLVVLGALLVYYGLAPGLGLLWLPVTAVLSSLLALGLGLWLSAFNLRYRDIGHTLPFLLQVWMFATPVVYPASLVPERWLWLLRLNPAVGLLSAYRAALLGQPLDGEALAVTTAVTALVLVSGLFAFRRLERDFADVV